MDSDLSSWLESDSRWPKFYYADVDAGKWYAGVGKKSSLKIDTQSSIMAIEKTLREFTKINGIVFAGIRFDSGFEQDEEWKSFGAAQFIAPAELRQGTLVDAAFSSPQIGAKTPSITDDWARLFAHSEDAFSENRLQKVVLASRDSIEKSDRVWNRIIQAPGSFRFAFSPEPGHFFYGASPELLFRKEGVKIQSDALAGTRPAVDGAENELIENPKDRLEHQLVVDFLAERFANFCSQIEVAETKIKHLRHLIHLHTLVSGRIDSENLVFSHLHPTPALCGVPPESALEFLREHEGFDRGWYGGTVGIVDDDFESFAVAIRSVLQTPTDAFVYFGAGIVPNSDCSSEWAEIHSKRLAILANLGEVF